MKQKTKYKLYFLGILILVFVIAAYYMTPRNAVKLFRVDTNDQNQYCYAVVRKWTHSKCVNFTEDERQSIVHILENMSVRIDTVDRGRTHPSDTNLYEVYFVSDNNPVAEFSISENGYIFDDTYRYEIIGENKMDMILFLRETCAVKIEEKGGWSDTF